MTAATTACPFGASFAPAARRSAVPRPRVGGGGTPKKKRTTIVEARGSASAVDRLCWEDASDEDLRAMVPRVWLEDCATAGAEDARDDVWRGHEPPPRLVDVSSVQKPETPFRRASRSRLSPTDARRFPGDDTFAAVARAVCFADVLPRKELFETWEAALVITEAFGERLRGGDLSSLAATTETRVADLAGGHGFLALALLVLNPALGSAVVVDRRKPDSHERLVSSLAKAFPALRLHARVRFVEASIADATGKENATRTVFAAVHACGDLSDAVLALAVASRAPVALVPCCHRGLGSARRLATRLDEAMLRARAGGDPLAPSGEDGKPNEKVSPSVAVDVARLETLRRAGYAVAAATLPREITPQNRVILGHCAALPEAPRLESDEAGTETARRENASPGWRSVAGTLPRSPWRRFGAARTW